PPSPGSDVDHIWLAVTRMTASRLLSASQRDTEACSSMRGAQHAWPHDQIGYQPCAVAICRWLVSRSIALPVNRRLPQACSSGQGPPDRCRAEKLWRDKLYRATQK